MATAEFMERVLARGVRVGQFLPGKLRAVTHLGVSRADVDRAIEVMRTVLLPE